MKTLEVLEKVLKGKRIKETTKRHYRDALGSLAKYSEDWPVSGVIINEWLASLTGFSDTTIKMWFDFVNSAGKYVKKAYKIDNPCAEADRPKVAKKKRRYFTPEEMMLIIKACLNEFEFLLVLTLIDSTCRIGELVGLKGGDIGEGFINVIGKTGERRYRLDPLICEKLKDMAGGDDQPVFKSETGGFYPNGDGLGHRVRYVVERAGITGRKIGVHTLRHSGASLVARETGSALAVKALLQHDDIKTSMRYIHDAEDAIQQKISPLRLLGKEYADRHGGDGVIKADQLKLTGGEAVSKSTALVHVNGEVVVEDRVDTLAGDMFPEIDEGTKVRPLLTTEDLVLMRDVFVWYERYNGGSNVAVRSRELMRRILKKVKGKGRTKGVLTKGGVKA
jgi:integrase